MTAARPEVDAVVVGAGFGGLGAALALAERGARVVLCETLRYPGGCASTFRRGGRWFEAGATLSSGLAPGQLFRTWLERHGVELDVEWLDPVVVFRSAGAELAVPRERSRLVEALAALPGVEREPLARFLARQRAVAEPLWEALDDPGLLPPWTARVLLAHLRRAPRYVAAVRTVGRPLGALLEAHGLDRSRALRTYLDALCRITVQCGVDEAEAPFALAALDYYHRGTGHVRGGIGRLAWALVEALRRAGGEVRLSERVHAVRRERGGWRVVTRRGELRAQHVVLDVLPQSARSLLGLRIGERPRLDRAARRVERGWGACMLYLVVRAPRGAPDTAHHLQLVDDDELPLLAGNHVFCSISSAADADRAPDELRTMTVSTHVPMDELRPLDEPGRAALVARIQERMRRTLAARAPEWAAGIVETLTASPRTFERFTGRWLGFVGGVPRRAGLESYRDLGPLALGGGLHLVGDTTFPGQSTLATATGGACLARRVVRS